MTRDGLPRAYLRIDPNIDQVYPELRGTFVGLMCAAGRQPDRGRFRDRRLVEGLCGKAYVRRAYERGDIVDLPDGRVYVDGWDEWQEGDWTVAERMRRMRVRRTGKRHANVSPVTVPPSHERTGVTTDAGTTTSTGSTSALAEGVEPPQPPTRGGGRANGTNPRAVAEKERETEREQSWKHRVQATKARNAQLREALVARSDE